MKTPLSHLGIVSVLCISTLGGYAFMYQMISDKSVALSEIENQIQEKDVAEASITIARSSLSRLEDEEVLVQGYFVPETNVVSLINDLEALGRSEGAVVGVVSVSKKTVGTHPAFGLNLSISGTFDAVMRTIGAIEFGPRETTVSTLSVAHDDKNTWHANMEVLVGATPTIATSTTSSSNAL